MTSSPISDSVLVIEPGRTEKNYWADLWRYRELFIILAWRDISVRYKQTVIGVAWAILRSLLTMIVFTVIFGRIAKLPSDGNAPYALLVYPTKGIIRPTALWEIIIHVSLTAMAISPRSLTKESAISAEAAFFRHKTSASNSA